MVIPFWTNQDEDGISCVAHCSLANPHARCAARYPGTGWWGSEKVQWWHLGAHDDGVQSERERRSEFGSGNRFPGAVSKQSKSHRSGRSSRSALRVRPGEGRGMGHHFSQCHGFWAEETSRWCSGVERKFHQSQSPRGQALALVGHNTAVVKKPNSMDWEDKVQPIPFSSFFLYFLQWIESDGWFDFFADVSFFGKGTLGTAHDISPTIPGVPASWGYDL